MALTQASFWPDIADCAETWRNIRWPNGPKCVACGSDHVTCRSENYLGYLCRYCCDDCGKWFSDLTDTELAYSKVRLDRWFYLMHELDKGRSVHAITEEIDVTYKTALRMAHIVRESLYWQQVRAGEPLTGEVEGDDIHVKGGQQGRELESRDPRERGLQQRGRGSYEGDRPLVVLWVARDSPQTRIEMRRDAGQRTLFRSAYEHIEPGSRVDTDGWHGYGHLDGVYDHRTVKHSETYVTEDGTHCNTAEGEWSVFKPWWQQLRGVAKRYIYLYLAEYEFRRSHRDASPLERLEEMARALFVFFVRLSKTVTDPFSLSHAS